MPNFNYRNSFVLNHPELTRYGIRELTLAAMQSMAPVPLALHAKDLLRLLYGCVHKLSSISMLT